MKSRVVVVGIIFIVVSVLITGVYYSLRWRPLLTPASPLDVYPILPHNDDTLRVIMLGDSWAMLQSWAIEDRVMADAISSQIKKPVKFVSRGYDGANSKDIYFSLFQEKCEESRNCWQVLLEDAPDYCIIIVGINDAIELYGPSYYCNNYGLIVRHLFKCGICPVIVEIPDVNLGLVRERMSIKERICGLYRSFLTSASMFDVSEYREKWFSCLMKNDMMNSVLYISREKWNILGYMETSLYRKDMYHLNKLGYRRLDSCIVSELSNDYQRRKK